MLIGNPMIFRDLPFERAINKMVEYGYDAVELWPPQIADYTTPLKRGELAERIDRAGLKAIRLNAADPPYFQALHNPDEVAAIVQGLRGDIDQCVALGLSQLLSWEGRRLPSRSPDARHGWVLDCTCAIFEQALAYAEPKGVSISIEVHPFTLGMDLPWCQKLCDRLASDHFGVVYDCCHFGVGLPERYLDAIGELGRRIKHVHFADSDAKSSEVHFAPTTGCLDLDGIVDRLKQIGFAGSVMLDLWLEPDPDKGCRIGVPYVRNVIERLGLDEQTAR